jgi:hypothetical protein
MPSPAMVDHNAVLSMCPGQVSSPGTFGWTCCALDVRHVFP